ncbi:MAG TPA: outer membrane beta-barrel protein [bacterium]|nr:outer membrane beta-barrel protein [bacterium]HPN44991.1 outer membrane beta-barrel protein [bacterium]
MKRSSLVVILLLVSVVSVFSQTRFQGGLNLLIGAPQSEFKENVDNVGIGLGGHFGYNIPQSPFILGGSLGFLIYGSDTREEPFSPTIPDVWVDVTTTNSIFQGHLMLRVQPQEGTLRPYLDGLFGFSYLSTTTEVKDQGWDDDDNIASSTNQDDFTSSYGGGGGLMIKVYEGVNQNDSPYTIFVDLGVRYLVGGNAEYLKEGSIEIKNGKVYYDLSESTTDLMIYQIGAAINF